MSVTTQQREQTQTRQCACVWYDATTPSDARTCLELRVYGYSPVMRRGEGDGSTEDVFLEVDMERDEQCECLCHEDEDEHDGGW